MTPEMRPISNRFAYCYRVFIKWASFFLFGLGTVVLMAIVFPAMRLCLHPLPRFKRNARKAVHYSMRLFVAIMSGTKALALDAGGRGAYGSLHSKILVANHPSLLDVVMLFSLIPNADCIVRSKLDKHIVSGIIRQLYISNSLSFEGLLQSCMQSLALGNCIIIFPEGTRTPRSGKAQYKKGAARLSLLSGCAIVPIHIGGTDKWGLGKHDPWWAFNRTDKYVYKIRMQEELSPQKYADTPMPRAVRLYNEEIKDRLLNPSRT